MQNVNGSYTYGVRNYLAPTVINKLHDPSNYKAAGVLPTWQFATVDPTGGKLSFERATAPQDGWHSYSRKGKVIVTGGSAAATNRVYTVFNGQQLVAALAEAGLEPKIVRIVGHIDLRWSNNNTVFKEYTGYLDQKFGGSIMIPSNTTLVGINDAQGRTARITGTSILIGGELANGAVDAETGYKA
ncbi:MAG: pectate lyase precursor, partial [Proteobacteria bacterium]|nr:pectate lyase precursor [Pseudomonadota bacterium]